jgi:hypothetical protein
MKRLTYLATLALIIVSCNKAAVVAPIYKPESTVVLAANGDTTTFTSRINEIQYTYVGGVLNNVLLSFSDSLSQSVFSWVGTADTAFNSPQTGAVQTIPGGNVWILQGASFTIGNLNLTYSFISDSANTLSGNFSGQVIGTNSAGQTVRYNIGNSTFTDVPVTREFQ